MLALLFEIISVVIAVFITPFVANIVHASGLWTVGVLLILVFLVRFVLSAIASRSR